MVELPRPFFTLNDLFKAYRKAKTDSFYDRGHFNVLAFSAFEQQLEKNLRKLLKLVRDEDASWMNDLSFIGTSSYIPKSLGQPPQADNRSIHFATLDPLQDWSTQCSTSKKRVEAAFRQVIIPTVNYQIVSALWLMKVGFRFDDVIDRNLSFAHEMRRTGKAGPVAEESNALFVPYMSGYRAWRSKGLDAMRTSLESKRSIVAVTMDVKQFYHRVSPKFLVNDLFLKRLGISLSSDELRFTKDFVQSLTVWYDSTPDKKVRKEGALPVGLSASRVISNVLLAEFDRIAAVKLNAIYYGRYADDIFLVVDAQKDVNTGEKFIKQLRKKMDGWLTLQPSADGSGLQLKLPYAKDSEIVFASAKQKIFFLSGDHGLDLIDQIVENIKRHSSEYRLLPELPERESQMVAEALLATPDARLEADALRKAEAVSIRRLGFSLLLGEVETYARDLVPGVWRERRRKFYGLVSRYVLTPVGYFDYSAYIIRVFGIMISCGDMADAEKYFDRLQKVELLLLKTTTAGTVESGKFAGVQRNYSRGLAQAAHQSATVAGFKFTRRYVDLIRKISRRRTFSVEAARSIATAVLKADLGRRAYHEYWFDENKFERDQPRLPSDFSVRRVLALTKHFRKKSNRALRPPYWPAIAFATRPIPLWRLCLIAPNLLHEPGGLEKVIWATRGSKVNPLHRDYTFTGYDASGNHRIDVPFNGSAERKFGLPSYLSADEQWEAAFDGRPDLSLDRYVKIRRLVNRILQDSPGVQYIAFPECSLPLSWSLEIAKKLGQRGVSFIAGIENRPGDPTLYSNDALVSLASNFFGRTGSVCFIQPKIELSHLEAKHCEKNSKVFKSPGPILGRPVYSHGGICFGVVICSDLTAIGNRAHFQGNVDALFVLEWNPDVNTFEFLVESASHDLHAAIIQVNNRAYGDSRVRLPFAESFRRDMVRVKGGSEDFYVVCDVDFASLRDFQRGSSESKTYKPLPIGYAMSTYRKDSLRK